MKLASKMMITLALAALVAAAGCSKGINLSTPKDTAKSMVGAVKSGDKAAFTQCFKASDDEKEFLGIMFDIMSKAVKLNSAIEKSYGADGLKKFKEVAGSKESGMSASLDVPTDQELDKLEVKIDGDKATCTLPGDAKPMPMVKVDNKWLISMGEEKNLPPKGPERDQALKMLSMFSAPMDKTLAKVGKSGETPASLAATYKTEMGAAMFGIGAPKTDNQGN